MYNRVTCQHFYTLNFETNLRLSMFFSFDIKAKTIEIILLKKVTVNLKANINWNIMKKIMKFVSYVLESLKAIRNDTF